MKKQVELYIDNGDGYARMDMFDFESISYTTRIQDIKDIAKVLTDYSHPFTVPASSSNNKVFKHYYKYDILNGFDARYKRDAIIKINGIDFRKGQISLQKANLKNNEVYSYSIVFYGETVSLKQLFGKDELEVLTASQSALLLDFSLDYTTDVVSKGFSEGFTYNGTTLNRNFGSSDVGDYCFPFISAEDYHYYDSADGASPAEGSNYSRNIHPDATYNASINQYTGVRSLSMKPAIRVKWIVKAIEEKYGITFSDDFFSDTNLNYYDMYIWMNREKGTIDNQIESTETEWRLEDFDFVDYIQGVDEGDVTINSGTQFPASSANPSFPAEGDKRYTLEFDMTPNNNDGFYSLSIINEVDGSTLGGSFTNTQGVNNFSAVLSTTVASQPLFTLSTTGGVSSCVISNAKVRVEEYVLGQGQGEQDTWEFYSYMNYTFTGGTQTLSSGIDVGKNLPKMTIIKFLDTLFKMFNLTAYYRDGVIIVKTLDDYYNTGKDYDISKYVDFNNSEVSKALLYDQINFTFEGNSTFAIKNSNDITNDEFGNEKVDHRSTAIDSPLAFDGAKKYDVRLPLEKMMYERMTDQDDEDVLTDVQWGWMANQDQRSIKGKPLFTYLDKVQNGTEIRFSYTDGGTSVLKTNYIIPINTRVYDDGGTQQSQSSNWGSEFNEYTGEELTASLFETYYKSYIQDIYSLQTRLIKIDAMLPASLLININPNDKMIINGRSFKVNKYETNLTTGKTKFELITEPNRTTNINPEVL